MINNSKRRLLKLIEILERYTDENTELTTNEILRKLEEEGLKTHRQTLYDDIEFLMDYGMDIICNHGQKNINSYCLVGREFDLPELHILINAVQYSYFITEKKSFELINKIAGLGSENQSKRLNSQLLLTDRIKSSNENVYYSIDSIQTAISLKRKIKFKYFRFTKDGKPEPRNNGEYYIVSPYTLAPSNNIYYLICFHDKYNDITQFRIDKMINVSVTDECIRELPENFNLTKYTQKIFGMFKGELKELTIHFHESVLDYIIEKFGDKQILKADDEILSVNVSASISPTFFAWIYQFGGKIRIISPIEVVNGLKQYTLDFLNTI